MATSTGRIVEQTPPGLTTVDDSDGFRHTTSSPQATGASMLSDLKLEPEVVEATPADADAAAAAIADPLDSLSEDDIEAQAETRQVPRKAAVKQLVKRAKNNRAAFESEKQRADRLESENLELKKTKPGAAAAPVEETPADKGFQRKKFEKPRPQFVEPEDPYDVEAMRAARTKHDNALEQYYDERDEHNREQTRLETEHVVTAKTEDQQRVSAAQAATNIIYQRGKARYADYDAQLQAFIGAGGKWSPSITEYILRLGTADLDLATDVTVALLKPANRAQVDRMAALPRTDTFDSLALFVARLERPAAVKTPAAAAVVETPPGPTGDVRRPTRAQEPFHPGGASPESPVHARDVALTAIPTDKFDVFMTRSDEESGRGRSGRAR